MNLTFEQDSRSALLWPDSGNIYALESKIRNILILMS